MKRTLILGAAIVLAAGLVLAGDYHSGDSLICSQCHVMHASLQHSYGGGTTGYPQSWTPSEYLLKGGINETCLICHDDDGAPDVLGPDTGYGLANRSAGGLNDANGPIDGYSPYMGHSLYSTATAPGDTGSFVPNADHGLTCVDCHSQHGRRYGNDVFGNDLSSDATDNFGNYRNLVRLNGLSVSYSIGTEGPNDLTRDVFEDYPNAYEWLENNLNEPVTTNSGFGEWCQGCHVNFHGAVGDPDSIGGTGDPPEQFVRHPNATVNIGAVGGGHSNLGVFQNKLYRVRVMSETGDWGARGSAWATAPATLTPTCLSCHKAHGNQRTFGLIYALGDAELGENGDGSGAKDLCKQCHVQG